MPSHAVEHRLASLRGSFAFEKRCDAGSNDFVEKRHTTRNRHAGIGFHLLRETTLAYQFSKSVDVFREKDGVVD